MPTKGTYYTHSDGLVQHYGPRDAEYKGRMPSVKGSIQQIELDISGAELGDAAVNAHLVGGAVIPSGAHIIRGNLWVTTAFAGATAVLDIGVYNADTLAAVDDDGIDAAIAVASLTDNAEIASDGALVDTTLAQDSIIAASYDTAAFTAGHAKLIVEYIIPSA